MSETLFRKNIAFHTYEHKSDIHTIIHTIDTYSTQRDTKQKGDKEAAVAVKEILRDL